MLHDLPIITIVTKKSSPRLRYIIHHIFDHFLGIKSDISESIPADGSPHIHYGSIANNQQSISIPYHKLLFEREVQSQELEIQYQEGLQKSMMVLNSENMTYDFDLFAWLFYLLSRYEEYHSEDLDEHGRYKSRNSLAARYEFIEKPLIDIWIQNLTEKINIKFGVDFWHQKTGKVIPSIDIDMPYAYHHKGFRTYIGMFRDLLTGNIGGLYDRWTYITTGNDPFDTFKELKQLLNNSEVSIFLLHNYHPPHDLNHITHHQDWKTIIQALSKWATLGIHPSYESHKDISKLQSEKDALESQTERIIHSRQHFLKLTFPNTYRSLFSIGIQHDHSMIYPDRIGFRASTSRPFLWYDLQKEEATDLLIHPYAVMDVTLRYYMKLTPNEAIQKITEIQESLKSVNGNFGFLWHNSSMSRAYGWKKWMPVLHYMIRGNN